MGPVLREAVATAQSRFFEVVHRYSAMERRDPLCTSIEQELLAEALAYAAVVFACREH